MAVLQLPVIQSMMKYDFPLLVLLSTGPIMEFHNLLRSDCVFADAFPKPLGTNVEPQDKISFFLRIH